jgi:hypothetical protein
MRKTAAIQAFLAEDDVSPWPDFAKFPLKFPVSREIQRETGAFSTASPARQCGFWQWIPRNGKKPANSGLLRIHARSPESRIAGCGGQTTESLRPTPRIFPFPGERGWRFRSIATAARGGQCLL